MSPTTRTSSRSCARTGLHPARRRLAIWWRAAAEEEEGEWEEEEEEEEGEAPVVVVVVVVVVEEEAAVAERANGPAAWRCGSKYLMTSVGSSGGRAVVSEPTFL